MLSRDNDEGVEWGEKARRPRAALRRSPTRCRSALNMIGTSYVMAGEIERGIGFLRAQPRRRARDTSSTSHDRERLLDARLGPRRDVRARALGALPHASSSRSPRSTTSTRTTCARGSRACASTAGRWAEGAALARRVLARAPGDDRSDDRADRARPRARAARRSRRVGGARRGARARASGRAPAAARSRARRARRGGVARRRSRAGGRGGARGLSARAREATPLVRRASSPTGSGRPARSPTRPSGSPSRTGCSSTATRARRPRRGARTAAPTRRPGRSPSRTTRSRSARRSASSTDSAPRRPRSSSASGCARSARAVPRGPRPATRANPAELTGARARGPAARRGGLRNADVAERLVLSPRTVDHHVSAILRKLDVQERAARPPRRRPGSACSKIGSRSAQHRQSRRCSPLRRLRTVDGRRKESGWICT